MNWLRRLHLVRQQIVALQRDADVVEGMENYVAVPKETWNAVMADIVKLMGENDEIMGPPPQDLWRGP